MYFQHEVSPARCTKASDHDAQETKHSKDVGEAQQSTATEKTTETYKVQTEAMDISDAAKTTKTNNVEATDADDFTEEMQVALENIKIDDEFNALAMETISELFSNNNNINTDVNPTTESIEVKVIEETRNELEMFVDSYEAWEANHQGDGVDGESSRENYFPQIITQRRNDIDAESDETDDNRELPEDPEIDIEMLSEDEMKTLDEISDLYEASNGYINPLIGFIESDTVGEHEREYEDIPQYMDEGNLMEITYDDMPTTLGHFNGDLDYPCGEPTCVEINEGNELSVRNEAGSCEHLLAKEVCNEEPSNPSLDSLLENITLLGRDIENAGNDKTCEHMNGGAKKVTVILTGDGGQVVQQADDESHGTSGLKSLLKVPVCIEDVGQVMLDLSVQRDDEEEKEEEQIPVGSAAQSEVPAGPNEETLEVQHEDRWAAEQLNTEINEEHVWRVDDDTRNMLQQLAREAGIAETDTESGGPSATGGSVTWCNDSEWISLLQLAKEAGIIVQF